VLDNPIVLEPDVVPRVWGGHRFSQEFGRTLGDEPVGESWEVHGNLNVPGSDLTLDQLVEKYGVDLVGQAVDPSDGFPLLTKWLDCKAWLSVQVHPDDTLAREFTGLHGARGKTEAWYVHRATKDAELIHGLSEQATLEELESAEGEDLVSLLNKVRPREGQLLFTPAGLVHALGPGNLIYEVQQSCDLTYRFYDWGRPREVHRDKALECVKRSVPESETSSTDRLTCRYFDIELLREAQSWTVSEQSFQILAATEGGSHLRWESGSMEFDPGQSVLLPAGLGEVELKGVVQEPVIRVKVPARL
jgi:mannose-6-phosphate isomerase